MSKNNKPTLHQAWIDPHAIGIVKTLQKGGYTTYLVGGCVRDLLIGITPKDFDIATSAPPQKVKKQVYQSYVIGKRFRLVLVKREDQQFEVATFRKQPSPEDNPETGPIVEDNLFGSPQEDANRRDFTINGLFYDPVKAELIDYTEGMKDIQLRMIRMIGDPIARLEEDPIRILRALRLAHKINFSIDPELREAMQSQAESLKFSVLPRRREEMLKILRLPEPGLALAEAYDLGILKHVVPTLHDSLENEEVNYEFFQKLDLFSQFIDDPSDNVQLFGVFLFSILKSISEVDQERFANNKEVFEEPFFENMMKDELGMFKYEQQSVARAVQLLNILPKIDSFAKRSPSRQLAMFRNEGFLLSLLFAEADCLIHPRKLSDWYELYQGFSGQLNEIENKKIQKRKNVRKKRAKKRAQNQN